MNSSLVSGSVFIPGEVISEPWLVYMGYYRNALDHGASIFTNAEVTNIEKEKQKWIMTINEKEKIKSEYVINCGGRVGNPSG